MDQNLELGLGMENLAELDGFVFIVQEYNHSITGALKNAIDFAREAWYDKVAGIVSYGSTGGARAAEHLRGILAEQKVADVRTHPTLSSIYRLCKWIRIQTTRFTP